jgi:hypothetical protein
LADFAWRFLCDCPTDWRGGQEVTISSTLTK